MIVSDLRHFLDLPADTPGPAQRLADRLYAIVRAATAGVPGRSWTSALGCSRRPQHRPCPGHLDLSRRDVPPSIEWRCTHCGDDGVISGWERSPFDLRPQGPQLVDDGQADTFRAVIPAETAAILRGLLLLDADSERLVYRATVTADGIVEG